MIRGTIVRVSDVTHGPLVRPTVLQHRILLAKKPHTPRPLDMPRTTYLFQMQTVVIIFIHFKNRYITIFFLINLNPTIKWLFVYYFIKALGFSDQRQTTNYIPTNWVARGKSGIFRYDTKYKDKSNHSGVFTSRIHYHNV